MKHEVLMTKWGEMTEGDIVHWHVKVGDKVEAGTELATVETEKVDAKIVSEVSGTVSEILFDEGSTVEVGTVIAIVTV